MKEKKSVHEEKKFVHEEKKFVHEEKKYVHQEKKSVHEEKNFVHTEKKFIPKCAICNKEFNEFEDLKCTQKCFMEENLIPEKKLSFKRTC